MREILFRGKLANGKWAYGNLDIGHNGVCIITPDDTPIGCYGQVDPETVGQYIGLTDKNGRRIFEGDVVNLDGVGIGAITFVDSGFAIGHAGCGLCVSYPKDREVVGNIHDNPELLTPKEE